MQREQTNRVSEELAAIAASNGGVLLPAKVVAFARNPETALHARFDWNDSEAAEKWRIEQARQVIRLNVIVVPNHSAPVRAYVSLSPDRENDGGGYRRLVDIMSSDALAAQMLADALADLRATKRKYESLRALRPVWEALESVDTRQGEKAA